MKNDWQILQKFYNFCYYLAITPFHSTNFNKPRNNRRRLFTIIVWIIVINCGCLVQMYLRRKRANAYIKHFGFIFDIMYIITDVCNFSGIILASNFLHSKNWTRIFRCIIDEYEIYFKSKIPIEESHKFFWIYLIPPFLIYTSIELLDMSSTRPFYHELYFIVSRIARIYQILTIVLFFNFLLLFKRRYNCLNLYTIQLVSRHANKTDKIHEMKCLKRIFLKMNKSIVGLSEIFGYFIFSYMVYFVGGNMYWTFLVFHPERIKNHFYYVLLTTIIYNWALIGLILINIDNLLKTIRQFPSICYILISKLKETEEALKDELYFTANQVLADFPEISVCGFFSINKFTLSVLCSTIATYTLVINQIAMSFNQ